MVNKFYPLTFFTENKDHFHFISSIYLNIDYDL